MRTPFVLLAAALLLAHATSGALALRDLRTDGTTLTTTTKDTNPTTTTTDDNKVTGNAPNPATAANALANATGGTQPVVPLDACSAAKSPQEVVSSGTRFIATLSGLKNTKPNTTGAPLD
jgi:hypothetical protein